MTSKLRTHFTDRGRWLGTAPKLPGATKLRPMNLVFGRPLALYPKVANGLIDRYKETGVHVSPSGGTLWVILQWCHDNRKSYTLHHFPNHGWILKDHRSRRRVNRAK